MLLTWLIVVSQTIAELIGTRAMTMTATKTTMTTMTIPTNMTMTTTTIIRVIIPRTMTMTTMITMNKKQE